MRSVAIQGHAMTLPGLLSWDDLKKGTSAITLLDDEFAAPVGAAVPLTFETPKNWPFPVYPRALGLAADALGKLELDPKRRYGLVLGMPNLFSETEYMEHTLVHREDPEAMSAMLGFSYDHPTRYLAEMIKAEGPIIRVDSACATGNDALIAASQWLNAGVVDDVVVVASSAMLNPVGLALFNNLKALNDRPDLEASCPFDRRRRGFVMGEGAAAAWLTKRPGDDPTGWICGYGQSMNAEKFVDLPEDLTPMLAACKGALGSHKDIAYVSAHGTATVVNDRTETRLHKILFGDQAPHIPLSSIKSMIGHTLGAAALIEAIVTLHALREGLAPPTINLNQPDPECDLNYVANQSQPIEGNVALSNAYAFGGQNASVLLSRELL